METIEDKIRRKLQEALNPTVLEVVNESYLHVGHAGDSGTGQTHFRVKVVSGCVAGLSRIEAQRKVYQILEDEMKNGIHAISLSVLAE